MKIATILAVSLISINVRAADFPYVAALASTTIFNKTIGGDFVAPGNDITPAVGLGYVFHDTVFVEADVCPTFIRGEYVSFGTVLSYGWILNPNFYSASRLLINITPNFGVVWIPSVGYTYAFSSGFVPFVEVEGLLTLTGSIGGESPMNLKGSTMGLGIAAGATYAF